MLFQGTSLTLSVSVLAAAALPVILIVTLVVCLSCFKRKPRGFSNFNNASSADASQGHVNTTFSSDIDDTNVDVPNSTSITIEPLPDVSSKLKLPSCPLRPRMGCVDKAKQDASLKMIVSHHAFPRNQLVYLKELGTGWFGKAIESDAEKITTGVPRSKVVVKMLKDDASKDEQLLFFEEVAPFRGLDHANIIRLLGQCTEMSPMLMIMESAAFGNLKQYLRNHRQQQAALIQKNRLMKFALDASSGVACLHRHDFLHRDLSARNCLVMSDHTLKIGDYGIAEELYKEDYMTSGGELLPIRWMAPETLKQENGTWSSHNFSKESDIWSLGVVLWEIAMLGERPYDMLTDEAVLQGVITDKDIRLPDPDIAMPYKDRLYEVMRFCWMEQSQRTKVDEVYKLLEQIASKAAEAGTGTAEDAFHQKWKHLVPNQRHPSVDSIDDRQGSVSSDDFNILVDDLSPPDSLENLAEPEVKPLPQAPPRRSKKKVSAPDITIPNAEEVFESSEATPKKTSDEATLKKTVDEQVVTPQIKDDAFPATMPPQQPQPSPPQEKEKDIKPSAEPTSLGSENDFTEFTSHDTAGKSVGETPNMSQVTPDVFPSPSAAVESASEQDGGGIALEDPSQFGAGDGLPKVQATVDEGSFVMITPDKPQAKDRKTSTPFGKEEPSPSSSSTFSAGDSSSATFITAGTSSPGNLTEAYATASDSTILTDTTQTNVSASLDFSGFEEQPSITGDSSLSFEILDTTPVPSVFNDFNTSTDDSQNTPMSNPFATSATNPFTGGSDSIHKDDSFGEFTDGSLVGENGSIVSKEPQLSTPAADPKPSEDASSPEKNDFGIFVSDSSMTVTQNESSETSSGVETTPPESKPAAQESPFDGFGTELSSLNSVSMPAASETAEPEQTFPSFTSDFSSLNSVSTGSAGTPQANAQSNPFVALEQATAPAPPTEAPAQSTEAQDPPSDPTGLGGLSFDILSSSDVTSTSPAADLQGQAKKDDVAESIQQASDLFGDLAFSNPPADQNRVDIQFTGLDLSTSPEKENQGNTQQSLTDLFGLGSPAPAPQDSSAGDVVPKENSSMPGTSSSSSDFDFLSGFSSPPAASSNVSSNPFGGDGGLLQDFVGSSAASASASQESQEAVLVANHPGDPSKSPDSSLLDFSAFESSPTPPTSSAAGGGNEENAESKPSSETAGDSSLIDF